MLRRVPQPKIDPARRSPERHDFWPGFLVAVVAAVLVWQGASRVTAIETVDKEPARETQLIKAFSSGGLKYEKPSDAPPPQLDDPAMAAEALERWAREQEAKLSMGPVVRVDTGASTPCPT
jgi:hypothetical protein